MEWVPTSIHFDFTQRQHLIYNTGLVEVDKPSFHSSALDSLSQAIWDIMDDGTPEEMRERRYSSLVNVDIRNQMPAASVCLGVLEQINLIYCDYIIYWMLFSSLSKSVKLYL